LLLGEHVGGLAEVQVKCEFEFEYKKEVVAGDFNGSCASFIYLWLFLMHIYVPKFIINDLFKSFVARRFFRNKRVTIVKSESKRLFSRYKIAKQYPILMFDDYINEPTGKSYCESLTFLDIHERSTHDHMVAYLNSFVRTIDLDVRANRPLRRSCLFKYHRRMHHHRVISLDLLTLLW
jgi:hypothetical protein